MQSISASQWVEGKHNYKTLELERNLWVMDSSPCFTGMAHEAPWSRGEEESRSSTSSDIWWPFHRAHSLMAFSLYLTQSKHLVAEKSYSNSSCKMEIKMNKRAVLNAYIKSYLPTEGDRDKDSASAPRRKDLMKLQRMGNPKRHSSLK